MGKITKILMFFVLLVAVVFLSFPVWSPWVIKTQMPTNIDLLTLESGYPDLQGIYIPQISFKINDLTINIQNLHLDYQLNSVSLDKILIEKATTEAAEINLFRIPELDILQLLVINKINQINIYSLQYLEKDTRLQASQLKLERLDDNVAQMTMEDLQLSGETFVSEQTLSSLELTVKLITDTQTETFSQAIIKNQGSELTLEISGDIMGHVSYKQPSYQQNEGVLQLKGNIDLTQTAILSTINIHDMNVKPNGPISFNWTQNRVNNAQQLLLESQLFVSDRQPDSHFLQLHSLNELSSPGITLPVNIKVTSNSEQFPIQANMDISSSLDTGLRLGLSEHDIKINNPVINIHTDLTLEDQNFSLDKGLIINSSGKLLIAELTINAPEGRLMSNVELDWQNITPEFSSGDFSMNLRSATADFSEYVLDNLQLSSNFKLSATAITANGELKMNQELIAPFTVSAQRESNQWKVVLAKNQLSKPLLNDLLNIVGRNEKLQLSINDGEVYHAGKLGLAESVQFESHLDVSDVMMLFGKNTINGLTIKHDLASIAPLQHHTDLSIDNVKFASGLDLKNISSEIFTTADDSFEIQSLKGEILSGKLSSQTIRANAEGFAESIMRIDRLSLMELFFFMDIPGLYAEGKISFNMPTSLKNGSLIVKDGTFQAEENGIIKYNTELTSSEGEENIALKALENFHYQNLDGTMSYDEDGFYKIKLHLLGANPDLYDGYPVDFTLNLQGELPGVFRSLFVTGNFEQAVMDKVKSSETEK